MEDSREKGIFFLLSHFSCFHASESFFATLSQLSHWTRISCLLVFWLVRTVHARVRHKLFYAETIPNGWRWDGNGSATIDLPYLILFPWLNLATDFKLGNKNVCTCTISFVECELFCSIYRAIQVTAKVPFPDAHLSSNFIQVDGCLFQISQSIDWFSRQIIASDLCCFVSLLSFIANKVLRRSAEVFNCCLSIVIIVSTSALCVCKFRHHSIFGCVTFIIWLSLSDLLCDLVPADVKSTASLFEFRFFRCVWIKQ